MGSVPPTVSATGRALAERWRQTIPSLGDHPLRTAFARRALERTDAGPFADALNVVCQDAELGRSDARQVAAAFIPTIVGRDLIEKVWSIRTTAAAASLLSVGRLLRGSTPDGHRLDERARNLHEVVQNAAGKPLSLGERRALARRPVRQTLDKLMRDPHPMVTRIVLANPRITEDDVVRMAAHRPAVASNTSEIAIAWTRSARVRMALVLNRTVPEAVSIPLLILLSRPELQQVVRAADLDPAVRATAKEYHELRPPMPRGEATASPH